MSNGLLATLLEKMMSTIQDWNDVPKEDNFKCRKCGSSDIEFRIWESSDGAHTDYNYHCKGCDRRWWFEGADY